MFSDPRHNIDQLGISEGMIIADLGSGSGFYSLEAARIVKTMGKVYAVDVQKPMLERLRKEAQANGIHNIDIIAGDLEKLGGTKLRENFCDVAIASNVLFMLEDKKTFLSEARRILKQKGRLLLIDWSASFSHMGPHPDQVVYKDDAMRMIKEAGFAFEREISAGAQHYGIICRKQ
jgi:ubiquinone/menaquinone biosynthesis C-methylase UbiE